MSPVLNCIPSDSPPDQEAYPKTASVASEGSNHTQPENSPDHPVNNSTESENSCCDDSRTENEDSSPTNNNSIPFNFKKSPSPADGLFLETPNRPWNSSPNFKNYERDHSVSPSSCGHRPSPRDSMSPDVSSENSRIPSHASSEAPDVIASPDCFRSPKIRPSEPAGDVSFPFHENRLSSNSFRLSNSLISDPISSYLRLPGSLLNPFQTPHSFLGNPFIEANDPKLLVGNPGLGLISQQLHHLNGISTSLNKIYPPDIQRMSLQQLHFLQSHLPGLLQPSPYTKFSDPKNHLSMLIQSKRHLTLPEIEPEKVKKDIFRPINPKYKEDSFLKAKKPKGIEVSNKNRKTSVADSMEIDNYEDNNSDSDELLSVGSASPPPKCQAELSKKEVSNNSSNASLNGTNCLPSVLPNRTVNSSGAKKLSNSPLRLPETVADGKTTNPSNRTLKFSIDNILKSDFGNEDTIKNPKQRESKKEKEFLRTIAGKKQGSSEKESPADLNQDVANSTPGTETPMLWPAWVYCTRYSDRPSSGPRTRRSKNKDKNPDEKRPRTAFSGDQLSRLKHEFAENRYLTERRRQDLARELGLNEAQIKIWFQNKRAKMKKARGEKNPLALQLMAQGLYNHSTVPLTKEEEEAAAAELSD